MVYAIVPTEEGFFVSEGFLNLSEVIQDYDHNLELRWIPSDKRERDDKEPYVIWDNLTNNPVIYAKEQDSPEEILGRLFMSDNKTTSVLERIEMQERAKKVMDHKASMEAMEEMHDQSRFLLTTPLHTVRMGRDEKTGRQVKLDDNRRRMA